MTSKPGSAAHILKRNRDRWSQAIEEISFDLSAVTTGEVMAAIESREWAKVGVVIDKMTPGFCVLSMPFDLMPVLFARFTEYLKSFFDPDNALKQAREVLEDE